MCECVSAQTCEYMSELVSEYKRDTVQGMPMRCHAFCACSVVVGGNAACAKRVKSCRSTPFANHRCNPFLPEHIDSILQSASSSIQCLTAGPVILLIWADTSKMPHASLLSKKGVKPALPFLLVPSDVQGPPFPM